ncbi:MAG: DNA polymerase/3'-5' exonuclease PolX [candidate division WS2 bacterium]|uniref:DNA polymerase/3'-5' exonuclease PolX n=1 Tax=Psychracetigena formicireducens TaxID=2986056 RepID=A0A9E2BK11_PSYF1|nr:DNA polymerase/3'-5' exonuclease PolX [Candidatus Psychracetigena formicireducens]
MTTQDFIAALELTATLMSLHGADEFKARAYASAAQNLEKLPSDALQNDALLETSLSKGMLTRALVYKEQGSLPELTELLTATPQGVQDLLQIAGLGPKKVRSLWLDFGVETPEALAKLIEEDKLTSMKGFGAKTQESLKAALATFQSRNAYMNIAKAWMLWEIIEPLLVNWLPETKWMVSGPMARYNTEIEAITVLAIQDYQNLLRKVEYLPVGFQLLEEKSSPFEITLLWLETSNKVIIRQVQPANATTADLLWSSGEGHLY